MTWKAGVVEEVGAVEVVKAPRAKAMMLFTSRIKHEAGREEGYP